MDFLVAKGSSAFLRSSSKQTPASDTDSNPFRENPRTRHFHCTDKHLQCRRFIQEVLSGSADLGSLSPSTHSIPRYFTKRRSELAKSPKIQSLLAAIIIKAPGSSSTTGAKKGSFSPVATSSKSKSLVSRPHDAPKSPPHVAAPAASARSNGMWFEGVNEKSSEGYSALYHHLDQQLFRGYGCLEETLVGKEFSIPNASIKRIDEQLAKRSAAMPCVHVRGDKGSLEAVPYVGTNFQGYRKHLTAGIAIQRIYMHILQRENARQSITPFAHGPKGEHWTLYIGDLVDSMNIPLLQQKDIGLVVSIHPKDFRSVGQDDRLAKAKIQHHSCRLDDSRGADMLSKLDGLIHRINQHTADRTRKRGRSVLIHCIAGLSRSVNVALGWAQHHAFVQEVQSRPCDAPLSTQGKLDLLNHRRAYTFAKIKEKRPGVKCDNFKAQLEMHAAQLVGYPLPSSSSSPPPTAKKGGTSEEHGGGGYLKEAVVWFYYIYHLRPSPVVIDFGYERITKAAAVDRNNVLQRYLKPWCDGCVATLQQ